MNLGLSCDRPGTAAFAKPEDVGHRLENLVYLELRRRGVIEVGYLATPNGYEVNFCGRGSDGVLQLVQVCTSLSDAGTRSRELRALADVMAGEGLRNATMVTLHEEEVVRVGAGEVRVVPAWRWLLEGGT